MVLHEHQANPHVHVSVRAESMHGKRLNPRKGDLHRWRETFAEKLRDHGIEAEATRQATRGANRTSEALCLGGAGISAWRRKTRRNLAADVAQSKSAGALNEMNWREFEMLVGEGFRASRRAPRPLLPDGLASSSRSEGAVPAKNRHSLPCRKTDRGRHAHSAIRHSTASDAMCR